MDLYYFVADRTPGHKLDPKWVPLDLVVQDAHQLVVELLVALGGTDFGIQNSAERPSPLQRVLAWFAVGCAAAPGHCSFAPETSLPRFSDTKGTSLYWESDTQYNRNMAHQHVVVVRQAAAAAGAVEAETRGHPTWHPTGSSQRHPLRLRAS